ncbi:MAG: T9SS type A sorting domain-containing protein [Candidatus Cloacimonetes bacterium]|nr:T9SS type A sorting domain-containing protein [Candidatus Cloacimonadota bacterium]
MRVIWILLFLIYLITLQGYWAEVSDNSGMFSYEQSERGEIELTFRLDGYEIEQIEREGQIFQRISHPESGSLLEAGMPELPVFTTIIAIPGQGVVNLEYVNSRSELLQNIIIYPQEQWEDTDHQSTDIFRLNEDYYRKGSIYPLEKVKTSGAEIMRDLRVLPVTFSPFRYNAAKRELEICREITAHVTISGSGGENEKEESGKISRAFEPIYRNMVLNYDDFTGRPEYQQPVLLFIIPDLEDALANLEVLKDWKRQKGYNVIVATTSETGTTHTEIKNYLQDAYDNWENQPEYVCFCGDGNGNYTLPVYGYGDHPYAQLAGDDDLEDVILGRLPFQTITSFQVLISKIFTYEKEPYLEDTEWYSRALLAGDPSHSGTSTVYTCKAIKDLMLDYPDNYNDEDNDFSEIYNNPFAAQMNNAINLGVSFMAYRGHDGMSGWYPGNTSNISMLPFATMITSNTGNWVSGTGASELFMQQGTISVPGGAIGAVGSSFGDVHTCFCNTLTTGIFGGIFHDGILSMGGAVTRGKYYLSATYPQLIGSYTYLYCSINTLLGDPSLSLWTNVPESMVVDYENIIPTGTNYLQVEIRNDDNEALEGAWVTLSNEEETFFTTGFSGAVGEMLLDLNGTEMGEYDLVVTSHNSIPHLGTITIADAEQYVDITMVIYNDASGNNDGVLNPGESVEIIPTFHNYGSSNVNNVNVTFSLTSDYLVLQNDELSLGNIAAGASITPVNGIGLEILPMALDGMQGCLEMSITDSDGNSWQTWHYLVIAGADLFILDYAIVGGGILEPGVEAELYFTVANLGTMPAADIEAELVSLNHLLVITGNPGSFGDIAAGDEADNSDDPFTVIPVSEIIPGMQVEIELLLSNEAEFFQSCHFLIPVGGVEVTDPLGPDEYGYWCYDDGDLGYEICPEYNWQEIDPVFGGEGTSLNLYDPGNTGDIEQLTLPEDFTFSFYGIEYDEITICSNGWIAPGIHEGAYFMNHPLPGPHGPSPMIAVFWDDLAIGSGDVLWFYDEDQHSLIVQWSRIINADTSVPETFEVIIYDPDYYQTITDDSLIKMQYLDVTNNNAGFYPSNHGQYCTIGLENENALIGLNYTFNNAYPAAAKVLEDEMALLFSPPRYPESGPYLETVSYEYLSGDDEFIEAGEEVVLSVLILNQGVDPAEEVNVELVIADPYFTVVEGDAYIEYIESLGTFQLTNEFSFQVSDSVTDYYNFSATLNMTTADNYWYSNLNFTAHCTNAFLLDQDIIDVELEVDQITQRILTITNISAEYVNYYLQLDNAQGGRNISGSFISCDASVFYPGNEAVWNFTVYNNSSDSEWIKDIWLYFPLGVTVISADDASGGSGGDLQWDGMTGDGVTVNWHGETANGWGVLHDGETATWSVNVTLSENFTGDIQVGWQIWGDGLGSAPHIVSGELNFDLDISWLSLNTASGTIAPGGSEEITVFYDAIDMEPGEYSCQILISSDSWFSKVVETNLTVVNLDGECNDIPAETGITGICPNPFNPSAEIRFELAEAGETELSIYNLRGQKVKTLLAEELNAGAHKTFWNGSNEQNRIVGSGIYYLNLKSNNKVLIRKMILLK